MGHCFDILGYACEGAAYCADCIDDPEGERDCGYTHRTREAAEECRRRDNATIRRLYGPGAYSEFSAVPGNDAARREDELSDEAQG